MYKIDWKPEAVEHIVRHYVKPYEVEEGINENNPKLYGRGKDRQIIMCQTLTGRYLVIVLSYPPETGKIRIITARDMIPREKTKYRKMKGGRK